MKKALIFDIQRFSLHDGPGIRTLIFFKGCSLNCQWCANPEGISFDREIRQNSLRCTGCGKCQQSCPEGAISAEPDGIKIDRSKCRRCGACVSNCGPKALSWWGEEYTTEELYKIACRDKAFYKSSGGGVTLGGGDPMLQNEQAVALLELCKENGLNTAIETAGNYPWKYLEKAAPLCDTIHFDVKGFSPATCQGCIGADNTRILDNLKKLDSWISSSEQKPALVVRIPLMPGYNFNLKDIDELGEFLAGLENITAVELLPFHNLGEGKYRQLGKPYRFEGSNNLKKEAAMQYLDALTAKGLPATITTM